MMQSGKRTGKVNWFDSQKGYGFINPDDGRKDIFIHKTSSHYNRFRSLTKEELVEFSIEHERGGRTRAIDVHGRFLNQAHFPLLHHHGGKIDVWDFNISYGSGHSRCGAEKKKHGHKAIKTQIQSIFDICHGPL